MAANTETIIADDMVAVLEYLAREDGPVSADGIFAAMKWRSRHYTEGVLAKLYLGGKLTRHVDRKKTVGFTVRLPGQPKQVEYARPTIKVDRAGQ